MPKKTYIPNFNDAKSITQLNLMYFMAKNELAYDYFEVTLVPESQIQNIDKSFKLSVYSDSSSCLYCHEYRDISRSNMPHKAECGDCPMSVGGNECNVPSSSYFEFADARDASSRNSRIQYGVDLQIIVDEYNKYASILNGKA